MSETEMNYMAKFSLDSSDITKGITGAAISFDAVTMAAKEAFAMIKEGYDMTIDKAVQFGEQIHTLADITGESEENIQRLRGAAIATGTDFDAVSQTIRTFSQRIGDTGTSGETLRAKLAEIGVQVKDNNGDYRSAADLYMEINKHLGDMGNVYERNNLAMDIYGRNWYNIADMINKADVAATAYNKVKPISDEDIARAKDFGIQLGIIVDHINMVGVDIGMKMLDDPRLQAIMGNVDPDSVLGMLLGVKKTSNTDNGSGADRDPNQKLKEQSVAVAELVDSYSGMNSVQIDYLDTQKQIAVAQDAYDKALTGSSQSALDTASMNLQNLKNKYADLRQTMYETATAANAVAKAINPYYDPGAIENQAPSTAAERAAAMAGIDYGSGANTSYYEGDYADNTARYKANLAFAKSDTTGNASLQALVALDAQRYSSVGNELNANYSYGSGAETFVQTSDRLMSAYNNPSPTINTVVNVPAGSDAQTIANLTAEAVSRALAKQVTSQ